MGCMPSLLSPQSRAASPVGSGQGGRAALSSFFPGVLAAKEQASGAVQRVCADRTGFKVRSRALHMLGA